MSLEMIRDMSREAAEVAATEGMVPFMVTSEDLDDWRKWGMGEQRFPFPNLGDHRPKGYEMTEEIMVDSSGMGSPGEPALTVPQLLDRLKPGMGYGITSTGQFQLYLGEFRKV